MIQLGVHHLHSVFGVRRGGGDAGDVVQRVSAADTAVAFRILERIHVKKFNVGKVFLQRGHLRGGVVPAALPGEDVAGGNFFGDGGGVVDRQIGVDQALLVQILHIA